MFIQFVKRRREKVVTECIENSQSSKPLILYVQYRRKSVSAVRSGINVNGHLNSTCWNSSRRHGLCKHDMFTRSRRVCVCVYACVYFVKMIFSCWSLTSLGAAIEEGAGCLDCHRRESAVCDLSRAVPSTAVSLHLYNKRHTQNYLGSHD